MPLLYQRIKMIYTNSPLSWVGSKHKSLDFILPYLGNDGALIEPMVGAGNIFLNTNFKKYFLSDINEDLINFYKYLQTFPISFPNECKRYFASNPSNEETYYRIRNEFNKDFLSSRKMIQFLWLNKHGYRGLIRYNQKGQFNVPFGHYKNVKFPEKELSNMAYKLSSNNVKLNRFDFADFYKSFFVEIKKEDVVYFDPPYIGTFSGYTSQSFGLQEHVYLNIIAKHLKDTFGCKVFISNIDNELVRSTYEGAIFHTIKVLHSVSAKNKKTITAKEVLIEY